jgi:TPR repeat protein
MKRELLALIAVIVVTAVGILVYIRSGAEIDAPPAAPARASVAVDMAALTAKAEQGDATSQAQLGKAYTEGNGVRRDFKQAAHWCGLAASNGNAVGETIFGELCQAGQGVPRNVTNAVQWFARAAEQQSVAAQFDLAFLYEQGRGVPHDEKLAAHWYQLASEGGDALAQFDFGQRRVLGLGVTKDPVEGLKWLLLSAAQGQADAKTKAQAVKSELTRAQVAEAKSRAAAFAPRASGR